MTADGSRAVPLGRLSAKDSLMWRLETHTDVWPVVLLLLILDGEVDDEALCGWHRQAAEHLPRMAARVTSPRRPGARPRWEAVPSFDPARHLRRVRAPGKAARAEVLHLAERFGETPFVSARPPWECLVVDGLDHGRSAYILKISHAIADGLRLRELFLRQAAAAPMMYASGPREDTGHGTGTGPRGLPATARRVAQAMRFGNRLWHDVRDLPRAPKGSGDGVERRYFAVDLPMTALRELSRTAGGTVQDALVAGLVEGCRRYNARQDVERSA
ncbi:wax ester/triacylglycerol synthase family O-acyltransferase [Streptomyces sp. 135]|uniref:wax ester/triacylglycerol synthase family O-acyltransferase n=1 Tax=Streptomyces sp. 135 TaxID=2838850 RepID=UPI001CBD024D|nr:wax ester/triacylglycerol synthase family O-acyltransferase [Streptomyces sp. 135]